MYARVRVPGSCGELVQGLWEDRDLLISCPIDRYSEARVSIMRDSSEITGTVSRPKALQAVKKVLSILDCRHGATVEIYSQLVPGKGLASSTADIAAAAWATGLALGTLLSPRQIADIAISIEPSDGTFFTGLCLFDYLKGDIQQPLGNPPAMGILTIDLGGVIDTINFNMNPDLPKKKLQKKKVTEQAFKLAIEGIKENSPAKLGKAATLSALANQSILPKYNLERLIELVERYDGYGVVAAHSGTVVGVLFDNNDDSIFWHKMIKKNIKGSVLYPNAKLIGGGLEVMAAG
ncbi:MAG: GHMP kinase [Zhaonellaceae bacterium]|jgi:L-threonine kinase|nr:GHMP kinase [Clostridia bacterium]